jgi:cbb3-type cytochrome oxidase maturation protein
MSVIYLLIPISIVIAAVFLVGFIWAVRSGQYEDTCTPSLRLLTEDRPACNRDDRHDDDGGGGDDNDFPNNQPSNQR